MHSPVRGLLTDTSAKNPSRIQRRNRKRILEAALEVFSHNGYRGTTLDQIAEGAGLSKPNILYYFEGKEDIHLTLLNQLMERWLHPLVTLDPKGEPLVEILKYVWRKLEMARDLPRESRLFAGEILQGAPHMAPELEARLKPLLEEKCLVIKAWMEAGHLKPVDPRHLIFSIWATTQHYADFAAQVDLLLENSTSGHDEARAYLTTLFTRLLRP